MTAEPKRYEQVENSYLLCLADHQLAGGEHYWQLAVVTYEAAINRCVPHAVATNDPEDITDIENGWTWNDTTPTYSWQLLPGTPEHDTINAFRTALRMGTQNNQIIEDLIEELKCALKT